MGGSVFHCRLAVTDVNARTPDGVGRIVQSLIRWTTVLTAIVVTVLIVLFTCFLSSPLAPLVARFFCLFCFFLLLLISSSACR